MNEVPQNSANLATKQTSERVFKALREARSQLEAIEQAQNEQIAIIGMAGRFPGADNLDEFWTLLDQGKSGIRTLSDDELIAAGVPESTFTQPNYVRAYASFSDPTAFDAQFFGYSPREAELLDPQHRVFLECAWSALEDAGYDSQQYEGTIGVYGGAALNSYVVNLHANPTVRASISPTQAVVNNVLGLMPTRVSYHLDLKGPSCGIQTGCSTSLVAIHSACQSLLNHDCDIALAGGVTVSSATPQGYTYQAESIASPDGRCYAFDEKGQGTVFGNGVGIVVLKRLQAALSEGDNIYAVIKSSAINNDGADKVGLIAPSISGQAAVIQSAIEKAGIDPGTISYVEGHGTGTPLGDPIEVAALIKAFKAQADRTANKKIEEIAVEKETDQLSCALGSVKTNLGHLDAAAGVAGLIKTVLALKHKVLPASLNYSQPNPKIDFQNGPFVVNQQRIEWPNNQTNNSADYTPRRAGVSSFGMGGTNAHAILEEAPAEALKESPKRRFSEDSRPWQLLMLSAKTLTALEVTTQNLITHLKHNPNPDQSIADTAYTLQIGRRPWPHRRFYLCQSVEDAIARLSHHEKNPTTVTNATEKSIVFMFSGQGSQHVDMARGLYEAEPIFKRTVDQCAEILAERGIDLLSMLYPALGSGEPPTLRDTAHAQPALFTIEYALAKLWIAWGAHPTALIGHSIGEYVAACVSGIFSLKDALHLVAQRGQLMQRCQPGSMLSVLATTETIQTHLLANAEIAVVNSPKNCVVSGPTPVIEALQKQLEEQNIPCRLLVTSHAFHSAMMASALDDFSRALQEVTLSTPQIDLISNVTGTWLSDTDATDPNYWVRHLRSTVRFSQGITELLTLPNPVLLEVGPSHTLTKLAQRHLLRDDSANVEILQSLPHPKDSKSDITTLLTTLGKLWLTGISIDWVKFHAGRNRHRLSLPTYPFERTSYWVPLRSEQGSLSMLSKAAKTKDADMANWFYLPTWKRLPLTAKSEDISNSCWLIFADDAFRSQLEAHFLTIGAIPKVIWVQPDETFSQAKERYTLQPQTLADYEQLSQSLKDSQQLPTQIVYGWSATDNLSVYLSETDDFQSLFYLTQALTKTLTATHPLTVSVITSNVQDVTGADQLNPERAKILGLCQVISQEYPELQCRLIDIESAANGVETSAIKGLCQELSTPYTSKQRHIAYRQSQRWVKAYEPLPLTGQTPEILKRDRTYLIAGDLIEGLGMVYAQALIKELNAKLILLGKAGLPAVENWEKWLLTHSPKHEVSQLIRKLQALGQVGEQFLWFSGHLENADWVESSVQQGIEKFGNIQGVFYAGVMGDRASCQIEQLSDNECDRISVPKVKGIQSLQKALAQQPISFYLIQSSLSSIVGGVGFGAYAAANTYLDTLAAQQTNAKTRWLSLNWDACQLEEPSLEVLSSEGISSESASELMTLALSANEVWQTTQRALAQPGFAQLIISPRSLEARLKESFTDLTTISKSQEAKREEDGQLMVHDRPTLNTAYVAPRNIIEKQVSQAMGDLLGIEAVGVHDNFFELGGHSLLAIQAVTQLRKEFDVELPMRAFLFGAPTVAGIAQVIQENMAQKEPVAPSAETLSTLENLLDQIEAMAPEEVEQ